MTNCVVIGYSIFFATKFFFRPVLRATRHSMTLTSPLSRSIQSKVQRNKKKITSSNSNSEMSHPNCSCTRFSMQRSVRCQSFHLSVTNPIDLVDSGFFFHIFLFSSLSHETEICLCVLSPLDDERTLTHKRLEGIDDRSCMMR